jgi:hypothetical protein
MALLHQTHKLAMEKTKASLSNVRNAAPLKLPWSADSAPHHAKLLIDVRLAMSPSNILNVIEDTIPIPADSLPITFEVNEN